MFRAVFGRLLVDSYEHVLIAALELDSELADSKPSSSEEFSYKSFACECSWKESKRGTGVYLRVSVTDRCDLYCEYCRAPHPESVRTLGDGQLLALVRAIHKVTPLTKIRITGGEPLLRPGVIGLIEALRSDCPSSTLALTTNGVRLAGQADSLRRAGVNLLNISVDAADRQAYAAITGRDSLPAVLDGLEAACMAGFEKIKINAVLLRSRNLAQLAGLARLAASLGAELRFIELMPIGAGAPLFEAEHVRAEEAFDLLKHEFALLSGLPASSTAQRYLFNVGGREVPIGFIRPVSHPFCDCCDRLRLGSRGQLRACLRAQAGVELAPLLNNPQALNARIASVVERKQPIKTSWPHHSMVSIGG